MNKPVSIIGDIAYIECSPFGLPVYRGESIPPGDIEESGRVVVHVGRSVRDKVWVNCWVTVNIVIPDIADSEADLVSLEDYEQRAISVFRKLHGIHDGTPWVMDLDSTEILSEPELKAHKVSCRLLFKSLNIN